MAIGDSSPKALTTRRPAAGTVAWPTGWPPDRRRVPGLQYANLAVRGKLIRQIVAEQVLAAIAMSPGLVSLGGGGNDIIRPGGDPDTLAEIFDGAVARLRASGCRVLMFTGADLVGFPVMRLLRGRIAAYNMHLRSIADTRGCDLVDLWSMRFLRDLTAWSPDRLHLTSQSHQRLALRACEVLGVPVTEDWRLSRPMTTSARWPPSRPAADLAGDPARGRPVGAGVPGPVGEPPAARHLVRRRRDRQAPRACPGLAAHPHVTRAGGSAAAFMLRRGIRQP